MSCQEVSPGTAWIEFAEMEELIRFLNLATRYEPGAEKLHNRLCHQIAGPMLTPSGEFQLILWDMFEGQEEQTAGSGNFFASIVFPNFGYSLVDGAIVCPPHRLPL